MPGSPWLLQSHTMATPEMPTEPRALAEIAADARAAAVRFETLLTDTVAGREAVAEARVATPAGSSRPPFRTRVSLSRSRSRLPEATRADFERWFLLERVATFQPAMSGLRLPPATLVDYRIHFERMLASALDGQRRHRPDDDALLKDIGLAEGRLVPAGSAVVGDARSRRNPRLLLGGGVRQLGRGLLLFGPRTRGFGPFLTLHWHGRGGRRFHRSLFTPSYLAAAEIVRANPALKGISGASWLLDPELALVSPSLAFVRELQEANGATLLRAVRQRRDAWGATATSRHRRRLVESGQYAPEVWVSVWPRAALLAWADRQLHAGYGSSANGSSSSP